MKTIGLLLLLASPARAQLSPDAWAQTIKAHYAHLKAGEADPPLEGWKPKIDVRCGAKYPESIEVEPWGVSMKLTHPDENLFFKSMTLTVRKLKSGDAYAAYRKVARPECMAASYSYQAIVQSGPYLISLDASCKQMQSLFPYEVSDLLDLADKAGTGAPAEVIYDRCGQMDLEFKSADWVRAEAKKKRKLYDHKLPDDRAAAKARASRP